MKPHWPTKQQMGAIASLQLGPEGIGMPDQLLPEAGETFSNSSAFKR